MEKPPIAGMYYPPEDTYHKLSRPEQIHAYIESFRAPGEHLCRQLHEPFKNRKYSQIVGVDTSGRLPTLLIHEFSKAVAKKYDIQAPLCLFIPPNIKSDREEKIIEWTSARTETQSVLVVDDTLLKGTSLLDTTDVFRIHNIPFDVAVFLTYNFFDPEHLDRMTKLVEAGTMYVGESDFITDGVDDTDIPKHPYKEKTLAGVDRIKDAIYLGSRETVVPSDADNLNEINQARKEIFALAADISNKILST